jgi:hypothetical protein
MVGYLTTMRFTQIRQLTGEPGYSELDYKEYDWSKTVYGDIREQVPEGIPDCLVNFVMLSHIREHEIADVTKKTRIYTILSEIFTLCLCF